MKKASEVEKKPVKKPAAGLKVQAKVKAGESGGMFL